MLEKTVQQGRSEIHGAKNISATCGGAGEAVNRQCLAKTPLADFYSILLVAQSPSFPSGLSGFVARSVFR